MRKLGTSLGTFLKIGIIAVVFILFFKWLLNKIRVPGLTTVANAV